MANRTAPKISSARFARRATGGKKIATPVPTGARNRTRAAVPTVYSRAPKTRPSGSANLGQPNSMGMGPMG